MGTVARLFGCALVGACVFITRSASAQQAEATGPTTQPVHEPRFALTIYSTADPATFDPQQLSRQRLLNPYYAQQYVLPGYGVVRERRPIALVAGANTVRFRDVAAGIDPTTVSFQSLTDPRSTFVAEQNYEYDVVNAAKLLDKYLGRDLSVALRAAGSTSGAAASGQLLSSDATNLVLQTRDRGVQVISRQDVTSISLAGDSASLVTKPTLVWTVNTDTAGQHDAQVTYQTDGLTWRADYSLTVDKADSAASLAAWVTVLNQSGASYPDARMKLVAGDVQRLKPPQEDYSRMRQMAEALAYPAPQFAEKAFFEYHLYTLGRTTSLPDNSTKQIELFPTRTNIPLKKTFVYYGLPANMRSYVARDPSQDRNLGLASNTKVDVYLLMQNTEANGLGIPLPAGRVRVYKQDEADGLDEFIGEDLVQHTPKDEKIMTRLGSAFDIVGERTQSDFSADYGAHRITESIKIVLRNHKTEPVDIIVKENLYRWINWEITQSSDKYEKQDSRTIHFPVTVPAGGEKQVTYGVKYTW